MRRALAIDPSVRSPGLSIFVDRVLVACERVRVPKEYKSLERGARSDAVGQLIANRARELAGTATFDVVAYEWPQIYTRDKSKGDPNDLIALAAIGAAAAREIDPVERPLALLPAEWAGQTPKATRGSALASPRGMRIRRALTPAELALVPDQHDALDGIGIGLYVEGRFDRHIVVPR